MSEQELEAKMKQILDDYGSLINVTPSNESSLSSSHKKLEKQNVPKNE